MPVYRLLIVDDEPFMREYTIRFYPWDEMGFEIAGEASNGQEALDILKKQPVDVILTDVLMPVMDGTELARRVAAMENPPRILFFSAYADFDYAKQAIESGVTGYILKLDDSKSFIQTLARVRESLDQERGGDMLPPETSKTVRQAVGYIRRHFRESITLADVAAHVAVHPTHLSRLLAAQLGKSYLDILTECRMEEAKRLLRTTQDKVYEVGDAVGYHKSTYFIDLFRRHTGMTPQQYRDHGAEEET